MIFSIALSERRKRHKTGSDCIGDCGYFKEFIRRTKVMEIVVPRYYRGWYAIIGGQYQHKIVAQIKLDC